MLKTFLENIYLELYREEKDGQAALFYWEKAFEIIEKYIDPKYDRNYVSNTLYDALAPCGVEQEMIGFKRGLTHALKLTVETMSTPEKTRDEAEYIYSLLRSAYRQMPESKGGGNNG